MKTEDRWLQVLSESRARIRSIRLELHDDIEECVRRMSLPTDQASRARQCTVAFVERQMGNVYALNKRIRQAERSLKSLTSKKSKLALSLF